MLMLSPAFDSNPLKFDFLLDHTMLSARMDLSLSSPRYTDQGRPFPCRPLSSRYLLRTLPKFANSSHTIYLKNPVFWRPRHSVRAESSSSERPADDFILEDVPHLTNFLPDLPCYPNPLQRSNAYAIVKETFVSPEDAVAEKIVVQKNSPRGVHFPRAGPREKVYFKSDEVRACIVTCGGLCPGINTVIREIVCGLNYMYGVDDVLGIELLLFGTCYYKTWKASSFSSWSFLDW